MAGGWKGRSRGGKAGYEIFIFLIRHFGVKTAYLLLLLVSLYFIPAAPASTVSIWRYARRILGYGRCRSALFIFRNYYSFGQSIIDRVAVSSGLAGRFQYRFEGRDVLQDALKSGKGTVIIGAHFGNWAAGEHFFREYRQKLNLVMFDNEHSDIKEVLEKNRDPLSSFKIIPVNKDGLEHVFLITEALNRGELVCFLGDRYVNDEKLLEHSLMGRSAKFPPGPFILASRLNVPAVFYFATRERRMTYRFRFVRVEVPNMKKNAENAVLEQFAGTLEEEMRRHPEQWYNYYDFWDLGKSRQS